MFDNIKDLTKSRKALDHVNTQLEDTRRALEEAQEKLAQLNDEIAEKEETIERRDEIIHAIHRQVTKERESILEDYAEREATAKAELDQTTEQLQAAQTRYDECERQVYCIANLYKSMRSGVARYTQSGNPNDLELTSEQQEELEVMEQSVGMKLNSYQLKDLKTMQEANNKLIEQLLTRYESRLIVPADRVVFQLMTLGVRAELQQILSEMEYGDINRAQIRLHLSIQKYLKIISFANLAATGVLEAYASELELLLKETIKVEHEFCLRRHSYQARQELDEQGE
ncbi:MAG: hypothetical protein Q4F79_02265 [Eubacteriales bacterium]|nr:hypothetical protein [Eubacteriales bacterium]